MKRPYQWKISREESYTVEERDAEGYLIRGVCTVATDEDARIISAAPSMLDALHEISAYLNLLRHRYCDEPSREGFYKEIVRESEKVRAAIAKGEAK